MPKKSKSKGVLSQIKGVFKKDKTSKPNLKAPSISKRVNDVRVDIGLEDKANIVPDLKGGVTATSGRRLGRSVRQRLRNLR